MNFPYDSPLDPAAATRTIRKKLNQLELLYTRHALDQLRERGLIIGDILHLLKYGFVYDQGKPATQPGCFKYAMEATTPNSGGRTLKVILIPSCANALKIITVMWRDETNSAGW